MESSSVSDICRANARAIVTAYRRATGLSVGQVSKKFYGNAGFLAAFLSGKQSMSLKKFDQVVDGIREQWPAEAEWPSVRAIILPRPIPAGTRRRRLAEAFQANTTEK